VTYNRFTSAEVVLPKGDYQYIAKVMGRKRDRVGNVIGHFHPNPILDTSIHEVMFPDGTIQDYSANVLAEALYSQVDEEGNRWLLLKDIIDHREDDSPPSEEDLEQRGHKYTIAG
jgi:hypothetical protein